MTQYTFAQLKQIWLNAAKGTKYSSNAWAGLMAAIALAESSGVLTETDPTDNNGTQTSWGLWQISLGNHQEPSPNWADPTANAQLAIGKLESQGLTAWGTYTSGAYKKYLNGATLPPDTGGGNSGGSGGNGGGLLNVPAQVTDFFGSADTFTTGLMWLINPGSWVRIGAFIVGIALLLFAIHALIAVGNGTRITPQIPVVIPV
jgi:hypothetical protein